MANPVSEVKKPAAPVADPASEVGKPATLVVESAGEVEETVDAMADPLTEVTEPATPVAAEVSRVEKLAIRVAGPGSGVEEPVTRVVDRESVGRTRRTKLWRRGPKWRSWWFRSPAWPNIMTASRGRLGCWPIGRALIRLASARTEFWWRSEAEFV